jgi:nitrate reductase NapE component
MRVIFHLLFPSKFEISRLKIELIVESFVAMCIFPLLGD